MARCLLALCMVRLDQVAAVLTSSKLAHHPLSVKHVVAHPANKLKVHTLHYVFFFFSFSLLHHTASGCFPMAPHEPWGSYFRHMLHPARLWNWRARSPPASHDGNGERRVMPFQPAQDFLPPGVFIPTSLSLDIFSSVKGESSESDILLYRRWSMVMATHFFQLWFVLL